MVCEWIKTDGGAGDKRCTQNFKGSGLRRALPLGSQRQRVAATANDLARTAALTRKCCSRQLVRRNPISAPPISDSDIQSYQLQNTFAGIQGGARKRRTGTKHFRIGPAQGFYGINKDSMELTPI